MTAPRGKWLWLLLVWFAGTGVAFAIAGYWLWVALSVAFLLMTLRASRQPGSDYKNPDTYR